ncbi:hypothetical protein Pcinc_032876 [Petrolisthes cinctipes]|uniref:Uncharacterized protein n=1 Tax=Petrolisthes cinctipes TaxID=88211 RepID=A0AAE1ETM3_PETCI|nr:hypothetical protein Pcinc_032876 [Petrolisthes cinctipes]
MSVGEGEVREWSGGWGRGMSVGEGEVREWSGGWRRSEGVGLKVLTERDSRQMDTMGEIWRSLTAWETLHCETMFPRCDGPKALEIVNDVALGSR